jgi:hypothetical protein
MFYKYKHSFNDGWFWQIEVKSGKRQEFKDGKGIGSYLFQLMQDWVDAGNKIEPKETEEEKAKRIGEEHIQAVKEQDAACMAEIKRTDHKMLKGYRYPDDVPRWEGYRQQLWDIIEGGELQKLPNRPF